MSEEIVELEFSGLLVSALRAMNIDCISAHFEGGGDSGSLSSVCEKSEYLVNFLGDRLDDFYNHIVEKYVEYNLYDNEGGRVDITIGINGQIQINTTIYERYCEPEELDVEISEDIKNSLISSINIDKTTSYTVHLKKSGYDEGGDSDAIYHIAYKNNYEPAEISIDSSILEYFDSQILGMTDEGVES